MLTEFQEYRRNVIGMSFPGILFPVLGMLAIQGHRRGYFGHVVIILSIPRVIRFPIHTFLSNSSDFRKHSRTGQATTDGIRCVSSATNTLEESHLNSGRAAVVLIQCRDTPVATTAD